MIENKTFYSSVRNHVMQHSLLKYNAFVFSSSLFVFYLHLSGIRYVYNSYNQLFMLPSLSFPPHQTVSLGDINNYSVLTWYLLYSRFCGKQLKKYLVICFPQPHSVTGIIIIISFYR